jgi:hypothetical protein
MTGQLRRGVVQDHDVGLAPHGSAQKPDAAQADVEAVGGAGVNCAVEQNAHVDVALPVRPPLGDAAEQIRRDDARHLLPEAVAQHDSNRVGVSLHTAILRVRRGDCEGLTSLHSGQTCSAAHPLNSRDPTGCAA